MRKSLFFGTMLCAVVMLCFAACSDGDSGDNAPVVDESVSYYISFDTSNFAVKSASDQTVTAVSAVTKYKNAQFTSADLPTFTVKSGYKLAGWYMDAAHTQAFSAFYATNHVRLYAKFATEAGVDVPNYVITHVDEYSSLWEKNATSGVLTRRMVKTDITGHPKFFCGWFYDSAYTNLVTVGDQVTADTALYGKWLSPSAINAGNGTTFNNHEYVDGVSWHQHSSEKNIDTDDYDYTTISAFTDSATEKEKYYLVPGVWSFDGAALYTCRDGIHILAKNSVLTKLYLHDCKTAVPVTTGAAVDMSEVYAFVAVKATGAGKVEALIQSTTDERNTSATSVAALVSENGTVLASQMIDQRTTANGGTGGYSGTLSATVATAGNVFLVFALNEDTAGNLIIESMNFTPAE